MTAALPSAAPGAMKRLIQRELRREWAVVTATIVATLVGSAAIAVAVLMIQYSIDHGVKAGDTSALAIGVVVYLVAQMSSGLAAGIRATLMARASERFIDRLRVDSLRGIVLLDLRTYEQVSRGDLLARVTADTESLSAASRWILPEAVRNGTDLAAALLAVALLDPVLALVALVAVVPMAVAGMGLRKRSVHVYPQYREEIGRLVGQVAETVEGADVVRSFGRTSDRLDDLRAANTVVKARYMDGTSMRNRFYSTITLTRVAATALVLVTASLLAISGRISIGTAVAGVLAMSTVFGPLAWLTELLDDALSAKAALERVVATTGIEESRGSTELPTTGDLELEGVTFGYVADRAVLRDISLTLRAGEHVAIVGPTGAGKSTLARLIAGLTPPDRGVVRFGGVDLADAAPESRRRRLVYVVQEPAVLTGTIADNVRLTAPHLADDEIVALAARLELSEWIDRDPAGIDRSTGTFGGALSAGERQLVGILRVAAADPALLVLDEATAVIDPATERLVGTALDKLLAGRTVVTIAHRPETARRASRILLVDDGHVVPVDDDSSAATLSVVE